MDRLTLLLRVLVLALVGWALSDPRLARGPRSAAALPVLDLSASLGSQADREPLPEGTTEWLAVADGVRRLPVGAAPVGLARGSSRLGEALLRAAAEDPGRDVLLVSDGRATDDALLGAQRVAAAGGRVFVRLPARPAADVALGEAQARREAGAVRVDLRLVSSVDGAVEVLLERDGAAVARTRLTLQAGAAARTTLVDAAAPQGPLVLGVRLVPLAGTPDDDALNNEVTVGLPAERGSVLLWGAHLGAALEELEDGPQVRHVRGPLQRGAGAAAWGAGALAAADAVVLADVPWADVGPAGVEALGAFVAGGGRLLVLGGPEAYAGGGYAGTPFERDLLPLVVRPPPPGGVDWVLALDVSGSTAGAPLDALREAARTALRALAPGERLAVLPFTSQAAPRPLGPGFVAAGDAAAAEALERALASLTAGGATDLPGGVAGALDLLATRPAPSERRVLLLTDGDPDEAPDRAALAALAPRLTALGARFAALVVDMPRAVEALRATLAREPGDVQLLGDASVLPAWLRRGMAAQRTAAEGEGRGTPTALDPLEGSLAALLPASFVPQRVHALELHAEARMLGRVRLAGGRADEAVFAAERVRGAGRVLALAWGPALEREPERAAPALHALIVRLAAEADRGAPAHVDGTGRLTVRLPEAEGRGRLLLRDGERGGDLLEVEPGLFLSEGPVEAAGPLRVQAGPGADARERALRLPAQPPPEHRGAGPDRERLAALAAAGAGRLLGPQEAVPVPARGPGAPLAPYLLLGAGILFVLERARAARRALA